MCHHLLSPPTLSPLQFNVILAIKAAYETEHLVITVKMMIECGHNSVTVYHQGKVRIGDL